MSLLKRAHTHTHTDESTMKAALSMLLTAGYETEKMRETKRTNISTTGPTLHVHSYLLLRVNNQPAAFVLQISVSASTLHCSNSSKPGFLFVNTHRFVSDQL